jgi:hypothetical protein
VFLNASPQCLAAGKQTEVGVRKRKQRKKGECRAAVGAAATPNPNPVVMLVVRLLASMPVPDNRIALADRTKAYDDLVAVIGPAGSKLPQPGRHWDKEDRYLKGASPSTLTRQDRSRLRSSSS